MSLIIVIFLNNHVNSVFAFETVDEETINN